MILLALILLCFYFTITDLKYRTIPNRITHPVLLILLIGRLLTWESSFLLGLLPAFIFGVIFFIRPSAIGPGDIKLFAIMGLAIGLHQTIIAILIMGITNLIWIVSAKCLKFRTTPYTPLAPFITIGLLVTTLTDYKLLLLSII